MPPKSTNLSVTLSEDEIRSLEAAIVEKVEAGETDAAWQKLQRLLDTQQHQREAAMSLLRIADQQCLQNDEGIEILVEVDQSYHDDVEMLSHVADCLEAVRDIDDLNSPPPDDEIFHTVVARLSALADGRKGTAGEETILRGLATAARMLARKHDELAEASYRRLVEMNPQDSTDHYNLGLFFKTRGRFEEGMHANQAAERLSSEDVESCAWNLGICATGAGQGAVALEVWKRLGQKIEMGRFDLPDGSYPQCKVKLAERPLAERNSETDDPGQEETIWIERLSPCHGIIRSVLYQDLGVNYGDVILMDGAPVTYHTYGDTQIPVFPHLATLVRRNYQLFDFAGTQEEARQLADVSVDLSADAILYAHSENYQQLCASCWRDPDLDHEHHARVEKHVVAGRLAVPGHMDAGAVLKQLDTALGKRPDCRLFAPDLCVAAGFEERASVDRRRFDMLRAN